MAPVRTVILALAAVFLAVVMLSAAWIVWALYWPHAATPIESLVSAEGAALLERYAESDPSETGEREILILGTPHLHGLDFEPDPEAVAAIQDALAAFAPGMVVVEHLPPEGSAEAFDYRREFDLEAASTRWGMSTGQARELVQRHRSGDAGAELCEIGRAYFVIGDPINAAYQWTRGDCEQELRASENIEQWWAYWRDHELTRFAMPVAERQDLPELVLFDYQGADAEWFIFNQIFEPLRRGRLLSFLQFERIAPRVGRTHRERRAREGYVGESLHTQLWHANSPEHIALQYWAYEQIYPQVEWENAGARQTANYWRRNEGMFELLEKGVEVHDPDRILVVVGSGHKYFLDELARDAGYRWIDPRDWLPPAAAGDEES